MHASGRIAFSQALCETLSLRPKDVVEFKRNPTNPSEWRLVMTYDPANGKELRPLDKSTLGFNNKELTRRILGPLAEIQPITLFYLDPMPFQEGDTTSYTLTLS